ncbi:MAG: hypothetical protein DMG02_09015 [Acidobacteria bacterium]|nr:MAG: hypothetical protein DMG02_09015 [Acidobacteriota bacterium]PYR07183.1 MAG: hypothetical protein DMF99_23835 [Acidobacteriota bacterium]
MTECELCGGRLSELARTPTRVWLGCRKCHRTWSQEAAVRTGVTPPPATGVPNGLTRWMSMLTGAGVALGSVGVALLLRLALKPALGDASPFLLFTPAVMAAAFYGGIFPGVLATLSAAAVGSQFFLRAAAPTIETWDRVLLFLVVGGFITASSALLRMSRSRLAEALWQEMKARAVAEAADRAKDDFLALVSHELRTPAAVVLGWASAIRQHRPDEATLDQALAAIERNARVQNRLVDDVLDHGRIATGTLRLDPETIALSTVIAAAVEQIAESARSKQLHIERSGDAEGLMVRADAVRLQQVFSNLLSNAVKFTPQGGRITIEVATEDAGVRVVVSDTGAGISPDFLPYLFEAFRQDATTVRQSKHGLGLGLALARHLVERHGGTLQASSEGVGRGASFTVTLPLERRRTPAWSPAQPTIGHTTGSVH